MTTPRLLNRQLLASFRPPRVGSEEGLLGQRDQLRNHLHG